MDFLTHSLLPLSAVRDFQKRLSAPDLPWRDGRLTAGDQAALVKNNHQLDPNAELTIAIANCIASALTSDPLVKSFSLVRKAHSFLVSRSNVGDSYGWHVDNPFSRHGRRDLSFTCFLSDEATYEGGSLMIQTGGEETKEFRLPPGQIVLYPSSTLHCVTPVVSGVRYVCVGWIESYIKAPDDRSMLFNIDAGARGLLARHGRSDELDLIFQSYTNAVRRLSN
ncbi:Fe2+-dependent dioxygenase [Synechococcus sp. AH-736-M02]|nr:Fe2+-dependent dioxygenase [Synechococcus sp. AH-736-M02]